MYTCLDGCGSTTFRQLVKQEETVHVDDSGNPYFIEPAGSAVVKYVECTACVGGKQVHDEETARDHLMDARRGEA